jgi:hypothetical protein
MNHPRVLVIMRTHWPRALLLGALLEEGYDATGLSSLKEALAQPADAAGRPPVGLIVVDHHISGDNPLYQALLLRHPGAQSLFLESALTPSPGEPPEHRLRYPAFIGDILETVKRLLPLSPPSTN